MFQRRPVGLWTTRSTEFPTSPTGLHYYYEFRQSSSTQNDEGPEMLARLIASSGLSSYPNLLKAYLLFAVVQIE